MQDRIASPGTELVIDGFERSGNWFAVAAFTAAQHRDTVVAHHLHASAQIVRATRLGIPTLVLVRRPEDAVVSQMIRTNGVRARQALAAWLRYYRSVETMLDEVVVADFEQVTQDFGAVIDAVNVRFSTAFDRFDPTPEAIRACFSWIEGVNRERYGIILERAVARPSSTREGLKEAYRQRVRSVRCAAAMGEATKVYDHLLERAHTQLMAARPA